VGEGRFYFFLAVVRRARPNVAEMLGIEDSLEDENAHGRQVDNHGIDRDDIQTAVIDSIHRVPRYEILHLSAHPVR
jgi:hypothetical protein